MSATLVSRIRGAATVAVAVAMLVTAMPLSGASASHRFGRASGWQEATGHARSPILVWSRRSTGVDLRGAVAPWNWLAGWELFRKARSRRAADVVFRPSPTGQTWTECPPAYVEPFHLCIVWIADTSVEMSRHELGHTLGFADHIPAAAYAEDRHFAAMVCDSSDHARFSRYRGVMSYCAWESGFRGWFGPKDRAMLKRAGYLSEHTLDRPAARSSR